MQGRYKGCKACVKQSQGVQGMTEAITWGARHVQGSYKGCKACVRQLQGCEAITRGARHVQGIYKACARHATRQI